MRRTPASVQARIDARREFEMACRRVARLFTRPQHCTPEDGRAVLELLREAFVEGSSMVQFQVDDTGGLVVTQLLDDRMVHVREGQKTVIAYLEHAIEVGLSGPEKE